MHTTSSVVTAKKKKEKEERKGGRKERNQLQRPQCKHLVFTLFGAKLDRIVYYNSNENLVLICQSPLK